eukprot:m51a1_g14267 hypothetical protein (440) ;mRNA; f:308178-310719
MVKHHSGIGDFCGVRPEGAYICEPTTSYCNKTNSYLGTKNRCTQAYYHRLGESCKDGYNCLSGFCSKKGVVGLCKPGLKCFDNVCTQPKANGTACKKNAECRGFCSGDHVCIDPYVQPIGAPCQTASDCASGHCTLMVEPGSTTGICLESPPSEHIPCRTSEDCLPDSNDSTTGEVVEYSCMCNADRHGFYCRKTVDKPDYSAPIANWFDVPEFSSCMVKHHSGVGEFCGVRPEGAYICEPTTSYCNKINSYLGTCAALIKRGGNCTKNEQCDGHWVDTKCSNNYCKQGWWHWLGERLGDCKPGLVCSNNMCVQPKANGTACTKDEECSGFCTDRHVCIDRTSADCLPENVSESNDPYEYSCMCDADRHGFYCRRDRVMADWSVELCQQNKGRAACEGTYRQRAADYMTERAFFMWGSDSETILPVAALVVMSAVFSLF